MHFRTVTFAVVLARAVIAFIPTISGEPQYLGLLQDPTIDRDSCGSTRFNDRVLWTCRDSEPYDANGIPTLPIWSSSASWTDFTKDMKPKLQNITSPAGNGTGLLMYGVNTQTPFFPIPADLCGDNTAGGCPDGTRFATWPDQPPLITERRPDGSIVAYTWVKQPHITSSLGTLVPNPETTLYRINYAPSSNKTALPSVTMVAETFWSEQEFPYGTYGGIVENGTAYLYGQNINGTVALAAVPVDKIEDKTAYYYYRVNNTWSTSNPGVNATGIAIPNASAGGQGTYFFSMLWNQYVWIGQAGNTAIPDFYITTSQSVRGPWAAPQLLWSAPAGNTFLPGYSLQAHPSLLSNPLENGMYLTYTKPVANAAGVSYFTTPLYYIQWK